MQTGNGYIVLFTAYQFGAVSRCDPDLRNPSRTIIYNVSTYLYLICNETLNLNSLVVRSTNRPAMLQAKASMSSTW